MEERPNCEMKECQEKALLRFNQRWICGSCYMKIYNKLNTDMWKEIEK